MGWDKLNTLAGKENLNGNAPDLLNLLPMAAYGVRAPDGVIEWFNAKAAELWGRVPAIGDTDERFCGAHTLYRPDGSYMAHCDTPVALALKTGISVHEEEVLIERPDGSRVTVSVHIDPIRDNKGAIVGVVNFFHDITTQKQAKRTNELLVAIVNSSDDAIVSKRLDGTITSWNKGAERLFGYSSEEAIGQKITLVVPPERMDEEAAILSRLQRGERVDHFETIRLRKDGTRIDISLTISPVRDGEGRIIGASKVARDITDRKRAEKALKESEDRLRSFAQRLESEVQLRTQELEKRNIEIGQQTEELRELSRRLLVTQDEERRRIARDLHDSAGQIVTALGMHLTSITQGAVKEETRKAAQEGHELIKQLSREIRTVSYLLHPPLLDENGLAGAIRWHTKGLADRSGLTIDLRIPDDFGRLPADLEVALFRIMQECLTNIHRHSGGKSATIRLSHNISTVSLEVQDNGKGMPEQILAAIRTQRSGVGITGMRERVQHLGGNLVIHSNSSGTNILVTLPIMTSSASGSGADADNAQTAF